MKPFLNLIGLAAAGYLGYMIEPNLRLQLTGRQPSAVEQAKDKTVIIKLPDNLTQLDLATLTPEQLPAKVLLKTDVKLTDVATGMVIVMQAGNTAKLVRVEGGNLVVSPGTGPFFGLVPVTETDLFAQLGIAPPVVAAIPTPTPIPIPPPVVKETIAPVPSVPERPAIPDTAPAPAPTPIATADPAPTSGAAPTGTEAIVKAMQSSISAAQIKEFTLEQVVDWETDADEVVDGNTYQIGLASYKAETIFGAKKIQAKAFIQQGKVTRWIWTKSGVEIN